MSYSSPIIFSHPNKENCEGATDLSSPLMVSAPNAHSTPLNSPELIQVRQKARNCLQQVLGSSGDFRSLPLEYCKNCRCSHPVAHDAALLSLGKAERSLAPTKRLDNFIRHIQHGIECKNVDCYSLTCGKAKKLMEHVNSCRDCEVYSQLMALCCEHSKTCNGKGCSIVYCAMIRQLESPQTARKRLRDEQSGGKTPLGKKSRNTKSVKVTPLARCAKFIQYRPNEQVNVMQVESPGVRGAFTATVSSPGCTDFVQKECDTNSLPEHQMSVRNELEEGQLQYSYEAGETSGCSDWESKEEFHRIVGLQKDLYNEIMEAVACKESKDFIDEKYRQFQQVTLDALRAADLFHTKSLDETTITKIRQEIDRRFMKASKLDWHTVTAVVSIQQQEEEFSMEHEESCRILDETNVMEENRNIGKLMKIPLYERTVKTVYRKVEKAETSRSIGLAAVVRSITGKCFHGIVAVLSNEMVMLLIIAYFLYFINN